MPELPEVEVVKKSLKKTIYDLTIKNIEISNKFLRYKINVKLMKKMINSKILSITRRSKYLFIDLNNDHTIMIHLGMTGKFIIVDANKNEYKTSFYYNLIDTKPAHNHLKFIFNKRITLIYNDVRKFGFIKIFKTKDIPFSPHLKNLGPEPLSKEFDFNYFKKNIKKRKLFLKDLLMNQKFVSGLGNIYVNEAIFLSKLSPKIIVKNISNKKIYTLVSNIKKVLAKAIKKGGSSIKNFNNTEGKKGNFQQYFNVYGRHGKSCTRSNCIGTIKRTVISNRSTFFCAICQK
ncbi:MAG: DNA-formamidopyrimidine glycosylase [Candidatus Pelagibacter sp.]|nr:DNA-formamidopyrimidine glycosylase [Candidatus Pelagibacter sp.]OUW67349.1 MAG: DNA-formamidopyrimidine glycosylase [Candidatus Pelagibacter sp. TMED202]|tara:strand:- start:9408 stop:10274 length:867 start_codon:yes stop_codon:yes gene_type:complete